jgi:serine phosphatase RsbU (regulator of sigma subunit)
LEAVDVAPTLRALNEVLASASPDPDGEVFCTAVFGMLARRGAEVDIQLGSGGHPYPLVRRDDGSIEEVPLGGSLLGALPEIDVSVVDICLRAGDMLLLFTDGVIEARDANGAMFGYEGVHCVLEDISATAQDTVDALEAGVLAHVGGELADDVAVLVLRVDP